MILKAQEGKSLLDGSLESTGGETKSAIAICFIAFITSYSTFTKEFKIYYNFPALFFHSKHLPVGPSRSLSLLHLFQVLPVWWPSCLIRSWPWPTWETRGASSVIKTATLFPYHTTTNLTSWKNARGSRKPVRNGPAYFSPFPAMLISSTVGKTLCA